MNLCSEKHDEICHDGPKCPICDVIEDLDERIESLEKELAEAEKKLEDAEDELFQRDLKEAQPD